MDKLGQAYGAGMAGGAFDPVAFIKKPQVILRIVSWVSPGVYFFLHHSERVDHAGTSELS